MKRDAHQLFIMTKLVLLYSSPDSSPFPTLDLNMYIFHIHCSGTPMSCRMVQPSTLAYCLLYRIRSSLTAPFRPKGSFRTGIKVPYLLALRSSLGGRFLSGELFQHSRVSSGNWPQRSLLLRTATIERPSPAGDVFVRGSGYSVNHYYGNYHSTKRGAHQVVMPNRPLYTFSEFNHTLPHQTPKHVHSLKCPGTPIIYQIT